MGENSHTSIAMDSCSKSSTHLMLLIIVFVITLLDHKYHIMGHHGESTSSKFFFWFVFYCIKSVCIPNK